MHTMLAIRRKAVRSAARISKSAGDVSKRYASGHGHAEHGHSAPKAESLGAPFFIAVGAIPLSIALYTISRPSTDGKPAGLTKFIDSYAYYKDRFTARNTLHTQMIEQAAFDRNLYQSSEGTKHVELRFPEIFNTGSPYNVSAGQGPRNMDQLVAHYETRNKENEEQRLEALETREKRTKDN